MSSHLRSGKSGFTLTELLIVVAIIAVIATIAVSRAVKVVGFSKIAAAESDLRTIASAITDSEFGYLRDLSGIPGFSPAYMRLANLLISTNVFGSASGKGWAGGVRLDESPDGRAEEGCAKGREFTRWNKESERGWRGPYIKHSVGTFPEMGDIRFKDDSSFASRGFFPDTFGLRLPKTFLERINGCSIYGFPGEPAIIDPWGNPYVLQVPPPQAFFEVGGSNTNLPDEIRFRYARVVSAGPDGRLDSPCFGSNATNWWATSWSARQRRLARQAGRIDADDTSERGDDIVFFLMRNDIDEGEEPAR